MVRNASFEHLRFSFENSLKKKELKASVFFSIRAWGAGGRIHLGKYRFGGHDPGSRSTPLEVPLGFKESVGNLLKGIRKRYMLTLERPWISERLGGRFHICTGMSMVPVRSSSSSIKACKLPSSAGLLIPLGEPESWRMSTGFWILAPWFLAWLGFRRVHVGILLDPPSRGWVPGGTVFGKDNVLRVFWNLMDLKLAQDQNLNLHHCGGVSAGFNGETQKMESGGPHLDGMNRKLSDYISKLSLNLSSLCSYAISRFSLWSIVYFAGMFWGMGAPSFALPLNAADSYFLSAYVAKPHASRWGWISRNTRHFTSMP